MPKSERAVASAPGFEKQAEAVSKTVDELGKLDILVNNAAFREHVSKLEELSEDHFDRTIKTNLYGVFLAAPSCSSYITGEVLSIIGGYSGG